MTKVGAALLIGVPVTFPDFVARVGESDWLSRFDESEINDGDRNAWLSARWQSEYDPLVAQPLSELVDLARTLDVDVRTGATLQVLREVTGTCDVVILFGHWKGHEIVADDLIRPVAARAFLSRAEADRAPLANWLQEQLRDFADREENLGKPHAAWNWLARFHSTKRLYSVREILAEAVENFTGEEIASVLESYIVQCARKRDYVDQLFSGLMRPGNRLELFDGLHPKQDCEAALREEFTGTLDLTTCTSTVLADYIGAMRKQRVRTVQFPAVQEFAWHSQCVAVALQMVAEQGIPYQQARRNAAEIVRIAVLELDSEAK